MYSKSLPPLVPSYVKSACLIIAVWVMSLSTNIVYNSLSFCCMCVCVFFDRYDEHSNARWTCHHDVRFFVLPLFLRSTEGNNRSTLYKKYYDYDTRMYKSILKKGTVLVLLYILLSVPTWISSITKYQILDMSTFKI